MNNVGLPIIKIGRMAGQYAKPRSDLYEIKDDVANIVKQTLSFKRNDSILSQMNNNKYLFDLPLLLKESLKISQISKIGDINVNTYDNNLFLIRKL